MDKPKGNWGGRRPNSGRKPKSATAVVGSDLTAALEEPVPEDVDQVACVSTLASIAWLKQQLMYGTSDTVRIDAAVEALDRGWGKPTVEAGADPMLPFLGRAPVRTIANEARDAARALGNLAITVLIKIRDNGATEAVRMKATRALLNRALGTVTPARVPAQLAQLARPVGKKEEAKTAARGAAAGRYAPPAPPPTSH